MGRSRSYEDRGWSRDARHSPTRVGDSHRSRYKPLDERDYQDMYDDPHTGEDDGRSSRSRTGDWEGSLRGDDHRQRHADDGTEGYSPDSGRYTRSRSHSRTREAGKPTDTVMLEGLPFGISTSSLREALFRSSIAGELSGFDVRVTSSRGNCRAFVQFSEVDCAISFVQEHFPKLHLQLPHFTDDVPDGKLSVYIHYARSQTEVDTVHGPPSTSHGDWSCASCGFTNFASRTKCKKCSSITPALQGLLGRTGAADLGREVDKVGQILVVFPLPPNSDEEMLAREMKRLELVKSDKPKDGTFKLKSTAPSVDGAGYGAPQGSLHRVFLMRDIDAGYNYRYGFVEFWNIPAAIAALKKVQMTRSFQIAGTPVTIGSIHSGVFIPELRPITPEVERVSFVPLASTVRVKYRDPTLYPSAKVITPEPPAKEEAAKAAEEAKPDPQKPKKRKADATMSEPASKKPPVMAAQMAAWTRRHEEIRGKNSTSTDGALGDATDDDKRPAPMKFAISGNFGSTKSVTPAGPTTVDGDAEVQPNAETAALSFIDRERLMCLICMMRYKSVADIDIHEKSTNHTRAMQDDDKVKAATARVQRRQKQDTNQYRDRAKERRETHNQPKKPAAQAGKPKSEAKPTATDEIKKPVASKAAGMLAKMGWTAGSGLGAQGHGTTEALPVNAYREGVGLGADGGKLGDAAEIAEGRTVDNYASYVAGVQRKARERYNQLG
ncbi:hypothetical protein HIM_05722 [Hirsutella minnesotensis 3608]|uniref:RNA-binding protein n=1 Tax=Hirsutella minnesotensis 3608 TaxID=1043627 RepID=A0A0F7ZUG3_9HYPO|nr:hypothetical protein HIM_05722 [Hirsutella minnesotensis 3608]